MLRASSTQEDHDVDIRVAIGKAESEDGGVQHGGALTRYAEAILDRGRDVVAARSALVRAIGEDATIQAASVVASFDGINRVADATGIRLDPESSAAGADEIVQALEIEPLRAARA